MLLFASSARAQPPAVEPPRVVEPVEATYPEDAPESTGEVAVVLQITVRADGTVADATIVESAGAAFDAAAVDAIQRFRFEPAKKDGKAIDARIRYRFVFAAPPPRSPEPPESAPPPRAVPEPEPQAPPAVPPGPVAPDEPTYGATAEVDAPRREPTRRTIRGATLTRVPGTRGDALRAVEMLPGVARAGDGEPRLRGSAASESRVLIEGTPVPLIYHFGGATSVVQSRLLERVDFYPGNFSVRYGRLTGGVIDAEFREPKRDRFHGLVDLSLVDSAAMVEAPVGDRASFALAARRSNIDFFFDAFVPEDAYSVVAAPVYWDYQALGSYHLGKDHRLRLAGFGGRDSIELVFADPVDDEPALRGEVRGALEWHRLVVGVESRLSSALTQDVQLAVGSFDAVQRIGEINSNLDSEDVIGRGEWRIKASDDLRVTIGFDVQANHIAGAYFGPRPPQNEGDPSDGVSLSSSRLVGVRADRWFVDPAAYLELAYWPSDTVQLVPGVRVDYFGQIGQASVDPRLAARFEVSDGTTLKSGVGLFSQPPEYFRALPTIGNPDLEPYRALHVSTGVEQSFGEDVEIGAEVFYKRLTNRVVAVEGQAPPFFVNDGSGRVYGAELSAEVTPTARTFGYLAYTLSRSERRDRNGATRLFDYDQTHILSVAGGYELGKGWEVGGRFRFVSGNPQTPVEGAVYDATSGAYAPVFGEHASDRGAPFHQLDVRVEKIWRFSDWSFAAYLELMNAYNSKNPDGFRYSYDYKRREELSGLPFFPNLGIRGEL